MSCHSGDRKIYIKSLNIGDSARVDWYFYSLLTNFSKSSIQFSNVDRDGVIIFESFFISDISLMADTLKVQLFKNEFNIDSAMLLNGGLNIIVDTTGGEWNQASSRLGRLQSKNIDLFKHHFEDSYCPNMECY